jgi:hydrogenase/urease accessory protein HupE
VRRLALLVALLASLLGIAGEVRAHALEPGYLELQLLGPDTWRVLWRKPAVAGAPMPIDARLPEACDQRLPPEPRFDGRAFVASWVANCPGGLERGEIAILGLEATRTDVLVRYELEPGRGETHRLTPGEPVFVVPETPGKLEVVQSYLGLGIDHILTGADHLLFVFALLLLIRDPWRLVGAVTAFTVAHSLTLAAASLGWLVIPAPPVEAVVALSIMFLASELLQEREGEQRLSARYPWVVAFAFGLLHGLGFASALKEIGLPEGDVPLALLTFNLGVEAGQLLFIAVILVSGWLLRQLDPQLVDGLRRPQSAGAVTVAYAIGGVSAYWFIARVAAF